MNKLLSTLMLLALAGCASNTSSHRPLYHWGEYQSQLYDMYSTTKPSTPQAQIIVLEKDIEVARSKDLPPGPGVYAHLGYLYFQTQQLQQARRAFETEKTMYPESAAYMDRALSKLPS